MEAGDVLDNRYQVLRPIGSGGMGSVWYVHDLERNRDCALKVLSDQGSGASPAIRREFESLAGLEHAGVVEVFDLHENYYTMEFVEGRSLGDFAGENVSRILDLACELCQILSYIHSQGVIHRDLKPENVMVTANERMVVMDFGLAMTRMRGGAKIAGTVHYMAPELLKGYAIDPRADLYSVGVILYQLATRRLPFDDADLMAAVLDHIRTEPPPPRRFNRELPEAFEKVILRGMAKDPFDRFQTAEELLDELRGLGGRSEIRQMRVEKGARILMEPTFVGREKELERLDKSWRRVAKKRRPGMTLVVGPRGIGTSRLMTEFAGRQLSVDEVFLEVDLSESHDDPLGPLSTLVSAAARQVERLRPELADKLNAIYGTLLVSAAPALAQESAALREFGEARVTPGELREVIVDYLTALAEELPLAILVHDLERLPKPMADSLVSMLSIDRLPLWVCGSIAAKKGAGPWRALLEQALGPKSRTDVVLEEMSDGELTRILASMVGRKRLDVDEYRGLLRMCLGRPGIAVELFRDLADAGQIYRKGSLWMLEIADITRIPRPELLEDALLKQVKGVSKAGRRLLAVMAMADNRLPVPVCAELGGLTPEQTSKAIGELVGGAYLLTGEKGQQLMPYRRLGETLVDELSEKRRRRLHRDLAERMERVLEGHPEDHLRIAQHYRAAGEDAAALEGYLRAGDGAKARQDLEGALDAYEKARELAGAIGERDKLVDALGQLGSLRSRAGDYPQAVELYREALDHLGEEGSARHQLFFRAGLGFALYKLRMLDDARKLFDMLVRAAPRVPENYLHLARVMLSQGELDEAESLLRQGLDIARKRGEVRTRSALYHQLGWIHHLKGMFPTAINFYGRATEMVGERDLHLRSQISTSQALWYFARSDPKGAYKFVEDTLYLAELTGDIDRQIAGTILAGIGFELDGDLRKALRLFHRALHLSHEHNRHAAAGRAHLSIARAAVKQQDPETATRHLSRSVKIFKELNCDWGTACAYLRLSEALLLQGDIDKSFHVLGRSERRFKAANLRWMLPRVYNLLADVHIARGDYDDAFKLLNKTLPKAKSIRDDAAVGELYRRYGRCCELSDRMNEANEHYVASRSMLGRAGDAIARATTELYYGRYLLEEEKRGELGSAKRALRHLSAARAVFEAAGVTPQTQRANRLIDEANRTATANSIDGLLAEADIDDTLDELRNEAKGSLEELARDLARQDGAMTDKAVLARFEAKLKKAEGALDKKITELRDQNTRLVQQLENLKRERQNLLTLQEINSQISATLDSEKLLDMILDTALELVGAERGFIMLVDEDSKEPEFKAARNIDKEQIDDPRAGLSSTIVRKVIRTREPLLTSDAQADGRFEGQSIQELRLKSLMCTPLECKGKVIGALYVDNRSASDLFGESDLDFMVAFSNQAALALENALLYGEVRKKERLEQELNIAARIQQSLLPKDNPTLPGLEVHGKMIPAGHLGGDYYDFMEADGDLTICIGDVSGKGVPASLVMVMARLLLHHLTETELSDTRQALLAANRILHANTEPFVFMSMLLLHWDKDRQRMRYTGAGHETLMVFRASNRKVEVVPAGGVVLGIKPDISELIEEKTLHLDPGDVVLLYTDGVTEAHNTEGDMFSVERLEKALTGCARGTAEVIVDALFEELVEFIGEREQHDDITITVIRRTD